MTIKAPRDVASDPIGALAAITDSLSRAEPTEFPRDWLLRVCVAELARYTIEDDYVDRGGVAFEAVHGALKELYGSNDWVHPRLKRFLSACRRIATEPDLPRKQVVRRVENGDHPFSLIEWKTDGNVPMAVSNAYANAVSVIENTLGHPQFSSELVDAFAHRIGILVEELGVDHLAFIEKEAGPVGAITMMTSLVGATDLPACVYRGTHWSDRAALTAPIPEAGARIAIVYDLIVTGSAVRHGADKIRELTGAQTVGSVVLCGYGDRRTELNSDQGQSIRVEALDWHDEQLLEGQPQSPGGVGEARNGSAAREASRGNMRNGEAELLPPGDYTRETLPPLSGAAKALYETILAEVREERLAQGRPAVAVGPAEESARLKLTDKPRARLKLTDKPRGSIFDA